MKIQTKQSLTMSSAEYTKLSDCYDLLCDMSNDSMINHIVNDALPCGFCVEDLRDGIQFIIDNVEVE